MAYQQTQQPQYGQPTYAYAQQPPQPQAVYVQAMPQPQAAVVVVQQGGCPNCGGPIVPGGIPIWAWILCICFFPIGLLFLLCREPSHCANCGFTR